MLGWRNLMKGLAGWGVLTMGSIYLIPESLASRVEGRDAPPKRRAGPCTILCPGLDGTKFRRMVSNPDYVGLSIAAAICMGAVRWAARASIPGASGRRPLPTSIPIQGASG